MSKRKGLNDAIYGDRASIRGTAIQKELTWDDFEKKSKGDVVDFEPTKKSSYQSSKAYGSSYKGSSGFGKRCYHDHPPLKLPGTDLVIFGGSCSEPAVRDADVYIGFDYGMRFTERHYPWKKGAEVLFKVQDMGIPEKPEEFKKLVDWTKAQLLAGKKVHCGCIGGHGRTGMFFAALCSEFGETDAISYVRENYCKKAVESTQQVKFLHAKFGIKPVVGSKSGGSGHSYSSPKTGKSSSSSGSIERFTFVRDSSCIWGA